MSLYVEVAVASISYHGQDPLTYGTTSPLEKGTIVKVPLRNQQVMGVVTKHVKKPTFSVKSVAEVLATETLPPQSVDLLLWMADYYASPIGVTTQQFVPGRIANAPGPRPDLSNPSMDNLPKLTTDQLSALEKIEGPGMFLLHGDTGTGKTRIYVELAAKEIARGKSAIILTPEIGLTSQLAQDFRQAFGNRVFVLHSQLKETVRREIWRVILDEKTPVVIIGPRSALFAPLRNVGLIAVDESHETAYKQDQTPYYHATRVASKLAELHQATVVLGSATPLLTDYYLAKLKKRPIVRMTQTAVGPIQASKNISIVDLRERNNQSKIPYLSEHLINAIAQRLAKNEQILLFLNRRGTARVVLCTRCGWQAICPHCDLSLVYHGDVHAMRCHSCSFKSSLPNSCPECRNTEVTLKSIGTKAVAEDIAMLFPEANIMRFDTDNKKSDRIEQHYKDIRSGKINIIVGTQTLAKGLDLPKLGLVGVIIADTSLYFPDFTSQERTYQLLYQVIGRIGRGHRQSQAIIQTYLPDNSIIKQVTMNEWDDFYNKELAERSRFMFPPFCHLLKLTCRRTTISAAQDTAQKLANQLAQSGLRVIVEGPSPCFHERISNKHCWQLVVKAKNRGELIKVIRQLPSGWNHDIDPMNLL